MGSSGIMGRGSDHHLEQHGSLAASDCATSISSSVMGDDCGSNSSRRGSDDIAQPDHKPPKSGPMRFSVFRRKESRYLYICIYQLGLQLSAVEILHNILHLIQIYSIKNAFTIKMFLLSYCASMSLFCYFAN